MRVLSAHALIRVLAIVLVLWVNVDIGFCTACASDLMASAPSASVLGAASAPHDAGAGQLPHPTHCFCHGQWVDIPSSAMPANPARQSGPIAETPSLTPETLTRVFDHPPRFPS